MEDDQLIILIKKYLDGNCTPEEAGSVEEWYRTQKDETALFHKGDPERIKNSSEKSLQEIRAKIAEQTKADHHHILPRPVNKLFSNWMAAASVAAFLICSGLFVYKNLTGRSAIKYKEITAANGQVIHITLSDHTSIWLNACSRLKYPETLTTKNREVYLEGEAYFDVKHDPSKPFLVHTSHLTTAVLGTAFSVTAYRNNTTQSVTVIRGKVQVSDKKNNTGPADSKQKDRL